MQGEKTIYKYPNATVTVYTPTLSKEEREKRLKEIKRTASELIKESLKSQRELNK